MDRWLRVLPVHPKGDVAVTARRSIPHGRFSYSSQLCTGTWRHPSYHQQHTRPASTWRHQRLRHNRSSCPSSYAGSRHVQLSVAGPKLPFGIDERENGSADLSDSQAQWPKVLSASADPSVTSRSTSRFELAPSRYEVLRGAPSQRAPVSYT